MKYKVQVDCTYEQYSLETMQTIAEQNSCEVVDTNTTVNGNAVLIIQSDTLTQLFYYLTNFYAEDLEDALWHITQVEPEADEQGAA